MGTVVESARRHRGAYVRSGIAGLAALAVACAAGAAAATAPAAPLRVAVVAGPPFAEKGADGVWDGLAIELWKHVAAELGVAYVQEERTLEAAEEDLAAHRLEVAIGAVPITADGEVRYDHSTPYYGAGIGVALPARGLHGWSRTVDTLLDSRLLRLVAGLLLALAAIGTIVWLLERRRNPAHFGGSAVDGVAAGVWWAAVTMTTVGYGDKTPTTHAGRVVALVWMLASVVIVASFTAAVTSTITVASLHGAVRTPADLAHVRLGAVEGDEAAEYLGRHGYAFRPFPTHAAVLAAVAADEIDAAVGSIPIFRALVRADWHGTIVVAPLVLEQVRFAFGLAPESPLREPIDRALLRIVEQDRWHATERRYLGIH